MRYQDLEIVIAAKDEIDGLYCAIVMRYDPLPMSTGHWVNTGIVVREKDPVTALTKVIEKAKEIGWK